MCTHMYCMYGHKHKVTNKHQNTNKTPEGEDGEIRGGTQADPTPIDSKEAWTPFFNKPTLHVPGTLSADTLCSISKTAREQEDIN